MLQVFPSEHRVFSAFSEAFYASQLLLLYPSPLTFLFKMHLSIWQPEWQRMEEKESSIHWLTLPMTTTGSHGPGWSQESHLDLQWALKGPNIWSIIHTFPEASEGSWTSNRTCTLIWMPGTVSSGSNYCATMLTPTIHISNSNPDAPLSPRPSYHIHLWQQLKGSANR